MIIGLLRVRLHIPDANSLKDKRSVLKRTIHRLRTNYNCAVAEVDDQDVWRSAVLAIVTVYAQKAQVESLFEAIGGELASSIEFELVEQLSEYL
ncbi:MAG: DUF503 domain-containing protein [Candidatus Sumerlaeaceae bacterium]|nr:DUF503 domain-containing protein [Candidatus Sumerlaeaceae bacterium]